MKTRRFLSLFLALLMVLSCVPAVSLADAAPTSVSVTLTAQAGGTFLCAPQFNVEISSDTAESYGVPDSVKDGVSAVDALVALHKMIYGTAFTKGTVGDYLEVGSSGMVTKIFKTATYANGFVVNGAYPNDGTQSEYGGYNGTFVTTQPLTDGDVVDFFTYRDDEFYSDALGWVNYKGNDVTEITAAPGAKLALKVNGYMYMGGYAFADASAMHAAGSAISGAKIALINENTGELTPLGTGETDENGSISVTAPDKEGTYYITPYMPLDSENDALILSLIKLTIDKNAPQDDPLALTHLSVASFDSNPNALELTPEFSAKVTNYSVPAVAFPSMNMGVFRSVYVKAAAASDTAVITAECNGILADVSGAENWTIINGALQGGKNNLLHVVVAESEDEDAPTRTYTVLVPMKPETNTAPVAVKESDEQTIMLGDVYSVDLSELFTDSDEVDTLSYTVSVNGEEAVSAEADYTFTPAETGTYTLVFKANDGSADSNALTVTLTVNPKLPKPASITIDVEAKNKIGNVLVVKKGDTFKVVARDENGNETPVTWKNNFYSKAFTFDNKTGVVTVVDTVYSGGTSSLYFTAVSDIDGSVSSRQTAVQVTGVALSPYNKAQTIALSEDGQTQKTASLSAGQNGHNIWTISIPDGVAELQNEAGNKNSIKFNLYRPGKINASFVLDIDEELGDSATITVTGVALETANGERAKTYLKINNNTPEPSVQLKAYTEEGKTIEKWESSDESVAVVDENGLVTAKSVGTALITATDNTGIKGGIKVVCESEEIPYFENIQFLSNAIKDYNKTYTFSPTVTDYALEIKFYNTSSLTLQNTTLYNTDKFSATAVYTDTYGKSQTVPVQSGAVTILKDIAFDTSDVVITLSDKKNAENKTVYTYHVTRPRDTNKVIKTYGGITLIPDSRALLSTKFKGYAEGTMFKLSDSGELIQKGTGFDTGLSASHFNYRTYILENPNAFALNVAASTAYAHVRYKTDGTDWRDLPQGGGVTDNISFAENENSKKVYIEVIDDKTYSDNVKAEKEDLFDGGAVAYSIEVEKTDASAKTAQILTANTEGGDWYPNVVNDSTFTYTVVVPKSFSDKTLTYTVSDGAVVKIGNTVQTAKNGVYTLALKTSAQTITVTSADGKIQNTYSFNYQEKKDRYPDKVLDYLCINSQYTNGAGFGGVGLYPWATLSGTAKSIGNFGGYITYYYDEPITDNPNNKYGIDFYVYGNANKDTSTPAKTSFFEPAQAWVSEDGSTWYALAGSAHYDDSVKWDYSVTYSKTANGKTAWHDSLGNSNDGASYSGLYPAGKTEDITLSGILLPARNGKDAVLGEATDAYPVKWGYADCFTNGTIGADVNPYTDNTNFDLQTNGFDLKWAVDENGNPVDVSGKAFHYVKLVTASNIWHSSFGEKSPEISGVFRTLPQETEVGKTAGITGVTVSDGAKNIVIPFTEDKNVYSADLGDMKYVSVAVNGAAEDDNIYVNNQRIAADGMADGFKVTKESGERKVRIVVQNGDKEPEIYLLKLTSTAEEKNDLIEGVKLTAGGSVRVCETTDGKTYAESVGYRISSVNIVPTAGADVTLTINGEAVKEEYELETGENKFVITGEKDGITHTVILIVTKDAAPASTGKIKVYFTLLGDDKHGESDEVHTLRGKNLKTWIEQTVIEVDSPATVLDVFEKALNGKYTFVNADGNYISKINGLGEFDNGVNSGWMFAINGAHGNKGVAEQGVKNYDRIVFHYTDDYTKEQGSEQWSSGGSKKDDKANVYTVSFDSNGGTNVKNQSIEKDKKVTKPTDPTREGYVFKGWFTDKALKKAYDFSAKVTGSFTLYAKWEKADETTSTALPFTDVKDNAWYKSAVEYAVNKKLFSGVSETEFAPESTMTRAMLVTVLYRLENQPDVSGDMHFTDVAENEWYTKAILWAAQNGIVSGVSETEFNPNGNITREQLATILNRYAAFKKNDSTGAADLSAFADSENISDWAAHAIKWAVANKLLNGTDNKELKPHAGATRAEVAAIFMRYIENVLK